MKFGIIGISGSPRKDGFTDALLTEALDGARSAGAVTEKIILSELNLRPCQYCPDTSDTGRCVVEDDMQAIYGKFNSANGFVIASPIFFGTLSAQLKIMIDRFQTAWVAKYILKKEPPYKERRKGIFLCAAGQDRREYFENAKQIIKIFFATLDIDYAGELFFGGTNIRKTDSAEARAAFKEARELGLRVADGSKKSGASRL